MSSASEKFARAGVRVHRRIDAIRTAKACTKPRHSHTGGVRLPPFVWTSLAGLLIVTPAFAQPLGQNLVINGDAETGDISGWIDGGIEAVISSRAGTLGLGPGVSLGDFCFTGAAGPTTQTIAQIMDVSAYAAEIDSGRLSVRFAGLLQARADGSARDTAVARLEFRDANNTVIDSMTFTDTNSPSGVFDWEAFDDMRFVPTATRNVRMELETQRTVGASSDGFFDNLVVIISTPCYADCDTSTGPGVLDIFDFLCFGNRFSASHAYACDCDLSTGPGVCDIFDFLCFGNAFDAGCP